MTERLDLDVVRKPPPSVDLDDRQPLPVRRLELGIAADVDLLEGEGELLAEPANLLERPLAEVAAGRVVDDYPNHAAASSTGRCLS
jgi:hypothetical protein